MSAISNRSFIKEARLEIEQWFSDSKVGEMFEDYMNNTLDTTVSFQDDDTFIITGDIPAMWLRDSVCQVRPFLRFAKKNEELQKMMIGLVSQQMKMIQFDPYANAFNQSANGAGHQDDWTDMQASIWERKYEIDSLCYPLQLSYLLWKKIGLTEQFNQNYVESVKKIVEIWEIEQQHETQSSYRFQRNTEIATDTLVREGKGVETAYTGMTWSGFRPSDDACTYGYLVPANMFAVVVLGYLEEILDSHYEELDTLNRVSKLKKDIEKGIETFAVIDHEIFGEMYAYEVDGFGNQLLMDDANVPSLLSLPFLEYCQKNDYRYVNTRKFILSQENPLFFAGKEANGVGSPHTPNKHVWPISLCIQGLTSQFESEKRSIINDLLRTDGETGFMHESFNVDSPNNYTREWFSWANMMFCELVLDIAKIDGI